MKRRHHSTNERKSAPATIRLSNNMRTVDTKSLDRVKKIIEDIFLTIIDRIISIYYSSS